MKNLIYSMCLRISITIIFFVCLSFSIKSQNIFQNPDFETYSNLPFNEGFVQFAVPWQNVIQSADFLYDPNYLGWTPQNGTSYSGNGYAGIATYGNSGGASEAIGQNISNSPLYPNVLYNINYFAKKTSGASSLGDYSEICGGIQLYGFNSTPQIGLSWSHISEQNNSILLWTSNQITSTNWQPFQGNFQVPETINYLVITNEKTPNCKQYTFLDKIYLNQTINIGNDTIICVGDSLILNATFSNSTYLWQDGSTSPYYTVYNEGTYWVEVTNSDGVFTDSISISHPSLPQFTLGNDTILCPDETLTINLSLTNISYQWQDGSNNSNIEISEPGIYWVAAFNGCNTVYDSIHVNFNILNVNLGNDTIICSGDSIILNLLFPNSSFLWQDGSTNSSHIISQQGLYSIIVENENCLFHDSIQIVESSIPFLNLPSDTSFCENDSITFNITTPGALNYSLQGNNTQPIFSLNQSGLYIVSASNSCGSIFDTININEVANNHSIGPDSILCIGDVLSINIIDSNISCLWSDNSTKNDFQISSSGQYWVRMEINNCVFYDSIQVNFELCESNIEFPNVFTPNNDGANDFFRPINQHQIKSGELKIFNRWGEKIFETDNIAEGWDGKSDTKQCNDGVYFWIAEYTNLIDQSFTNQGFVHIFNK